MRRHAVVVDASVSIEEGVRMSVFPEVVSRKCDSGVGLNEGVMERDAKVFLLFIFSLVCVSRFAFRVSRYVVCAPSAMLKCAWIQGSK